MIGVVLAVGLALNVYPEFAKAQIEEIIVTATKRQESMQQVPIVINALSGDQLDALDIRDTDDIVALYPNLSLQASSGINSGFTIRAVGTDNFHITGQQAVGQYMDEVSLLSPFTSLLPVYDLERIEVIRGPQNTLFGRNTTGGAVNYISRKPEVGGEFNGYGRIRLGNEGRADFEGALGIPLGETTAMRIAGTTENRDSIWNNLAATGHEPGEIERYAGRIQLLWQPNDRAEVLLSGKVGYNRGTRPPRRGGGIWDPAGTQNVNATDAMGNAIVEPYATARAMGHTINSPVFDCPNMFGGTSFFQGTNNCVTLTPRSGGATTNPSTNDWHDVWDHGNPMADVDFEGGFVNVGYDFDAFSLTSITSYDEISIEFLSLDIETPQPDGFYPGQSGTFEVFSQELRLTSTGEGAFRWIAGVYYSDESDRLATIINRTDDGAPPFGVVPSITIDQDVNIFSAYGQIDFDTTANGTITAGLRFTDDSKSGISTARVAAFTDTGTPPGTRFPIDTYISLAQFDVLTDPPSGLCPPPVGGFPCRLDIPVTQDLDEFGWNLIYNHQLSDDVMGYASYSKGFKSGAFDTRALAAFAGTADQPVAPEFLDAFEIGAKSTLADGNVELNGAVFFYIWEDRQTFDVDNLGRPAFVNIPEAEILGAEVELRWASSEGWFVQGGIGYIDSEITDDGNLLSVTNGAPLSNAPELSINGLIVKDTPIGDNNLRLQTNFQWQDEYNSSLEDDLVSQIDSIFIINARGSYAFGDEQQYEFSLWADNLTEEETCFTISELGTLNYTYECQVNDGMVFYGATFVINF